MIHHNGTANSLDYQERYQDAQVLEAADERREMRQERFADDTGPINESTNDFWKRGEVMKYRSFSVNHATLKVTVIGDFTSKDDADEATYLDRCDEPAPDKDEYFSWHVTLIANSLAQKEVAA